MPKKKTLFSKDTKFAELLTDDRRLLQLLPRFGIGLGFGDRSVDQVCESNRVNTDLFLMICEIYSDGNFKPGQNELQHIDMGDLLSYLKASHLYYLDERFHVTLLTVPIVLLFLFTILPILFTIFMAFTNYDEKHQPPGNMYWWTGVTNFQDVFYSDPMKSATFGKILVWTLVWAVFATFTNYIFGMILALLINKKEIKFKSFWRTMFVVTAAVPQFVTLLLMRLMLDDKGAFNNMIIALGGSSIPFLTDCTCARITVIIVNMWVGVPYTMLITSGLLMNIPEDLYESARIDGANAFQQFTKITFPYIFFVTTPYLITTFVGNINNFNVIYFLTGGGPSPAEYYQAGQTDLLVTWLYKLTVVSSDFNLAAVIGIIVFIICATGSLITFNMSKAAKNEEEFS